MGPVPACRLSDRLIAAHLWEWEQLKNLERVVMGVLATPSHAPAMTQLAP